MNENDMKLNAKSEMKIVMNISVQENETLTTRNLEYSIETKVRKYLQQR